MFGAHPMFRIGGAAGYQIPYSLRFRAANSAYLSRTFGTPTNNIKWTWSGWIKRGALGAQIVFDGGDGSSNNFFAMQFTAGDLIQIAQISGGAYNLQMTTSAVFRDPSAWYHIVVVYDSANATSTDRVQIYINNSRQTVSYATGPFGASTACQWNVNARTHYLRRLDYSATYGDMYAAEENFIDGQALTPSSFGQTDATTGVWVPKKYSGTYGSNGFYLKFADATTTTTIGNDSSGNANNWATSGISVTSGTTFDQMTDTPTLNYPVWSSIDKASVTVSEANMAAVPAADVQAIRATVAMPATGKWYWETTVSALGYGTGIGIADNASNLTTGASSAATRTYQFGSWFNSFNGGVVQYGTSQAITSGTNWSGASQPAANDVIMVAVDMDNGSMWVGKNGTWFNTSGTANPATNTDPRWTGLTGTTWFPYMAGYGSTTPVTCRINFGQRAFSYTPPTGFKALNTANLPTPSIKRGSLYMDATLRTGTGATASVSSLGFQPDLVWIKGRSGATDHGLYDAVRGVQKQLESNTTTDETTEATGLTAFSSNGYTVGALAQLNTNAATYVDWAWKEGVTSGFDIVTYTGNGVARTISHALGSVPKLMIVKARSTASTDQGWAVYHSSNTAAPETDYLLLDSTAATADLDTVWNDTAPTSSVFSVGTNALVNTNTDTYVAYLWSEVEGFSKFGSYTGNASTDGPFVWCGFRPRFVMLKDVTNVAYWVMIDTVRNTVNVVSDELLANTANAENGLAITTAIDCTANGFKIRTSDANLNQSGDSYIFAAFAENPFKYARAR